LTCDALKPIHKNRQDDIKYTFDVDKCDRIFYELHKGGYIKISHTLPPLEELKRRVFANGIILSLMLLTIAMFSIDKYNWPLMKDH
jgi:hypothetical protein